MNAEHIEYAVCGSCLIAAANDDYTGMDDNEERSVRAGLERLGWVIADGEELGFSWRRCECCDALPGERYRLLALEHNTRQPLETSK